MDGDSVPQAAAVVPVLLVFYVVVGSLPVSGAFRASMIFLLVLAVLAGLLVSLYNPRDGLASLIASVVLGYALHTTGYISMLALASITLAHLAGLGASLLKGMDVSLGAWGARRSRRTHSSMSSKARGQATTTPRQAPRDPAVKIMEALNTFRPVRVRDEEDLEKQLYQYLRAKGFNVERQPQIAPGLRPDLRVDDCILEIKVPQARGDLQRLVGQAEDYLEHGRCLII